MVRKHKLIYNFVHCYGAVLCMLISMQDGI